MKTASGSSGRLIQLRADNPGEVLDRKRFLYERIAWTEQAPAQSLRWSLIAIR